MIHNEPGHDLQSLLLSHLNIHRGLFSHVEFDSTFGVHAVHRLDRQTSGNVLFAASQSAFRFFSEQFTARQVDKTYQAIVHGHIFKADKTNGSDISDGESWGNAKKNIVAAIDLVEIWAHGTVLVATGTYDEEKIPLVLVPNLALLGGYPTGGGRRGTQEIQLATRCY